MFNVLEHRFSVTCGMLHVKCNTYDMSHITFHVSYVTGHRSGHFLGQETNIKSIEYKQDYVIYAEMAKNDPFWPKMTIFDQKLWKTTHQAETNYFLIIPIPFLMTLLLNTSKYMPKIC